MACLSELKLFYLITLKEKQIEESKADENKIAVEKTNQLELLEKEFKAFKELKENELSSLLEQHAHTSESALNAKNQLQDKLALIESQFEENKKSNNELVSSFQLSRLNEIQV